MYCVSTNSFLQFFRLPLPWLIWSILNNGSAFEVVSSGLFCSTVMLFAMLLTVVISIAVCKWKMSKTLGFLMLILYVVFVVFSVLVQKDIIECRMWGSGGDIVWELPSQVWRKVTCRSLSPRTRERVYLRQPLVFILYVHHN